MDYKSIYSQFIESRRQNPPEDGEYFERHHIVPRCMGGGDEPENIIPLIPEDHFFAHLCLAKGYKKRRLWAAVWIMINKTRSIDGQKSWTYSRKEYGWIVRRRPQKEMHPMADNKKHTFYHLEGGVFRGTRIQFSEKFKIPAASVNALFYGRKDAFCYGWSLKKTSMAEYKKKRTETAQSNGKKLKGFVRDKTIYKFYNTKTEEVFWGSQSQMKTKGINPTTVWALCNEQRMMSRCGWCLYKNKYVAARYATRPKELSHRYNDETYNFKHIDGRQENEKTIWEMGQKYAAGDSRGFGEVARGKRKGKNGWFLEGNKKPRTMNLKYVFCNDYNETIKGNMKQIAQKIGVHKASVQRVVRGRNQKVKGWRLASEQGL